MKDAKYQKVRIQRTDSFVTIYAGPLVFDYLFVVILSLGVLAVFTMDTVEPASVWYWVMLMALWLFGIIRFVMMFVRRITYDQGHSILTVRNLFMKTIPFADIADIREEMYSGDAEGGVTYDVMIQSKSGRIIRFFVSGEKQAATVCEHLKSVVGELPSTQKGEDQNRISRDSLH